MTHTLVLLRHGQSRWNLENRFTGWVDVELSSRGVKEALSAGQILGRYDYQFDLALTSLLKRSIHTLWLALTELDQMWVPIENHWQLNERHYGALQGLNKKEMAQIHGDEQVHRWRRGYAVQPPAMNEQQLEEFRNDPKYANLSELPATESLADTYSRVVQFWESKIKPELIDGKRLFIVAHGNSLRALVKYLDDISDDKITQLNIPTGIPLIYQLDSSLKPIEHFYLADEDQLNQAVAEVKNQGSAA